MEFKEKLKKLRMDANLTQEALAKILFVSRSAIAKWEAGLGLPASDSLEHLCSYFGVSKEELIGNFYNEDDLIQKNITIVRQKRRIMLLILSTILFLILGIVLSAILLTQDKKVYITNETLHSEISLKNYKNQLGQEMAYAGDIEERMLFSNYVYSYQTIDFERIPFTEESNLILFHLSDTFVPGIVAYSNDEKKFAKNAILDKIDIEVTLEENPHIQHLYSWPNYEQEYKVIHSSYGNTLLYDASMTSSYLKFDLLNNGLGFYYDERFDSLVLSPDRKEKLINFYYKKMSFNTKWSYDILGTAKDESRTTNSYYLLEVKKEITFEITINYSVQTGKKITQKNHHIICET